MEFVQDFSANYGVAERISPLITRVLCENPSPYTYTGTATYLVGDSDGLAIIDPGPFDTKHGKAILEAAAGRPISHIFVTHTHIDHSPLSNWLSEQTGAPIFAHSVHGAGRKAGLEGEEVEMGADRDFIPDRTIADGEIFSAKDWTLEAIHTPGHTSNHMCFLLRGENTMFVGDHVMGWATTVISPPDGDMRAYLASLKKIQGFEPDKLVPTHGPWIEKPKAFIRGIITHRRMREGQILKHLEQASLTIDQLVEKMYIGLDKRLVPAAARSVLGHLVALVDEDRAACEGPVRLSSKFTLGKG